MGVLGTGQSTLHVYEHGLSDNLDSGGRDTYHVMRNALYLRRRKTKHSE